MVVTDVERWEGLPSSLMVWSTRYVGTHHLLTGRLCRTKVFCQAIPDSPLIKFLFFSR